MIPRPVLQDCDSNLQYRGYLGGLRLLLCGDYEDHNENLAEQWGKILSADPVYGRHHSKDFTTLSSKIGLQPCLLIDSPHYVLHTITGELTVDAALLTVDACRGIQTQARYHSVLLSLIGIPHLVIAINSIDQVDYSEVIFNRICEEYRQFAQQLDLEEIAFIPMSVLKGDNITQQSDNMTWYEGPTLKEYLETVEVDGNRLQHNPFRMPVQRVNRSNLDFRGFSGTLASGIVRPGDEIRVQPSGKTSRIERIYTYDGDLDQAVAGQSVTLTLQDETDISRGDVISGIDQPAQTGQQFETSIVWMHEEPLFPGRPYLLKIGTQTVTASVTDIKYRVNVNTLEHTAAKKLKLNNIAVCNISLDRDIAFDPYRSNRDTGGFILIDRISKNTVAAGMLHFALRRSQNIHKQHVDVNKRQRAHQKHQQPAVLWFTGLSGAGKSTVANLVEKKLYALGHHTYLLDGDNVRHGLNKDLGFTDADRVENIRRVAEVAKLMVDAGLIVLSAFISPFRSERDMARTMVGKGEFVEIFMDTPLDVAEARDPKGLYKKARRGELKNFTGIDSAYEQPEAPEVTLQTANCTAEEAADQVITYLMAQNLIPLTSG